MSRLMVFLCALSLVVVCGCKKTAETKGGDAGPGATKPAPPPGATPTQVIEDWLAGTGNAGGKVVSIIKEDKTTFRGKPAQAVAAKYTVGGEEKTEIFILQDDGTGPKVARHLDYDMSKPFDDNVKEVLKD